MKGYKIHDKNTLCLPRHSSFNIMQTFASLVNTGHNVPESIEITTVYTTKAHRQKWDKGKCVGRNS
jgi:hypothetical protein